MVSVVAYTAEREEEFLAAYNRSVELVPDCYPVRSADAKALQVARLPQPQPSDDDGQQHEAARLERQRLVLAVEQPSGGVVGYCAYVLPAESEQGATAYIRYLWYDLGHRAAGEALLDHAEGALRAAGATRVQCFGPGIMPFHKNLSDKCVHIRALFTMRGYAHTGGELYINWLDFGDALERLRRDAEMPDGVSSVTVEEYYWDDGNKTPRPSTRIFAVAPDGEKLGICETISSNEYDDAPQLADTCFVSWLGVPPVRENLHSGGYDDRSSPVQGRGLGVRLHTCARALRL
jgi:hypothetical protein